MCYNDSVDKCKEDSKGFSFCYLKAVHEYLNYLLKLPIGMFHSCAALR